MSKYYRGFTTFDESVKDRLARFLKLEGIYFEPSGYWEGWHFEIKVDANEEKLVNDWLDKNV